MFPSVFVLPVFHFWLQKECVDILGGLGRLSGSGDQSRNIKLPPG